MLPVNQRTAGPTRVGYVLKVYPRFSETFVVTEILAREAAGEDLAIFALRPTTDARFHPEIAKVQAPVTHLTKPVKLSGMWESLRHAHAALPGLGQRLADALPFLLRIDATDAIQGIDLAIAAVAGKITHLHAHFGSMAARVAAVASALTGIPFSVTTHAKDLFHQDVDPLVLADVLTRADHIVAISRYNERFLQQNYPQVAARTRLVRNGLNLSKFAYTDPRPLHGPLHIAAVGRLVEKKGFTHLIDSIHRLRSRPDAPDLEVRIAGDGELRDALQAQISISGLDDVVHLIGPRSQDEIRDLLTWADVMVAPCIVGADGNADGLPTVLLEAMAMGVPVIASDVTGIGEAVNPIGPTQTGILLDAGRLAADDGSELDEALRTVADPAYPRVAIARRARTLIERDFDAATQSQLLAARQGRAALQAS
ncbi:glycosyltransferase [Cumulibacter soli]|uniref:glycosyltransferase n=1 Tax=Cumulibacter soli TaxID=2546344 RepID=UPI0010673E89|nr:glycosyltransferase [Cumulibacter soli]